MGTKFFFENVLRSKSSKTLEHGTRKRYMRRIPFTNIVTVRPAMIRPKTTRFHRSVIDSHRASQSLGFVSSIPRQARVPQTHVDETNTKQMHDTFLTRGQFFRPSRGIKR